MLSASKFLPLIALAFLALSGPNVASAQGTETDVQAWSRVHATSDVQELRDFAGRYPSSGLADIARARADLLERKHALDLREREAWRRARMEHETPAKPQPEPATLRTRSIAPLPADADAKALDRAVKERAARIREERRLEQMRRKVEAARARAMQLIRNREDSLVPSRRKVEGQDGPTAPRREPVSPSPAIAPVLAG